MIHSVTKKSAAFSLVELSIVLVILGLLTGGILAGQSLIRAAEMRGANSEFQRYVSATYSFRDKYMAIPGDMTNADKFWGLNGDATTCKTTASTTTATCNGDGNGMIETTDGMTTYHERFSFWKHLANAGMIEGAYDGVAGAGSNRDVVGGVNSPRSRVSNAAWGVAYRFAGPEVSVWFATNGGNFFTFGGDSGTLGNWVPVLKPEEAWNIDTKADDGSPATGSIITQTSASTDTPNCLTGTGPSSTYRFTETSNACSLIQFITR